MSVREPHQEMAAEPGHSGMPRYRLVHVTTSGKPRFDPRPLAPGVTYIGRLPSNDIVIESELVSRRHAKLIVTDMGVTVHDLDSHNGVFLNGKKVRSAPVMPGDLLYIADVCCALAPAGGEDEGVFDVDSTLNRSQLASAALGQSEDDAPAVRNLAALYRATDLLLGADDERFLVEVVSVCRDLTEASLAVLALEDEEGKLQTPVMLREGTGPKVEAEVAWSVVRRAIDERVELFSRDAEAEPLVPGDILSSGERGAIMCVPVLSAERALGALYLARPAAGQGFTDRELETLSAIAHLVAVRLARPPRAPPISDVTQPGYEPVSTQSEDSEALAQAREELEGAKAEAERLAAELEKARAEAAEQRARAERYHAASEELARALEAERARVEEMAEVAKERSQAAEAQGQDLDALRAELAAARAELERARGELEAKEQQLEALRAKLAESREALEARAEELRQKDEALAKPARGDALWALARRVLSKRLIRHIEALADGATPKAQPVAGPQTLLCLSLFGVDAWAQTAPPEEVKSRLDAFCAAVRREAAAHGGALEQVLGHVHLLRFQGDAEGVRAAARCALFVSHALAAQGGMGLQAGLHLAPAVAGLFGEAEAAQVAYVGEAVAIARGASEYAQGGQVLVSEAVRRALLGDEGFLLIAIGPHIVRGLPTPVNLYQLTARQGGAA